MYPSFSYQEQALVAPHGHVFFFKSITDFVRIKKSSFYINPDETLKHNQDF